MRAITKETFEGECSLAYLILKHAHKTCAALAEAFRTVRKIEAEKNGKSTRGNTSDKEQDLLRAMLVFACAGLDSMLKQLIRDAVPRLSSVPHSTSRDALQKFVRRRLGGIDADEFAVPDRDFLTTVLLSDCTLSGCIEALIEEKTGRSLQARGQIEDVLPHLGVDNSIMQDYRNGLDEALKNRNEIIHEMDINFGQPNRSRFQRKIGESFEQVNLVLELAEKILKQTNEGIKALPGADCEDKS